MAISCEPNDLLAEAKCFKCIPAGAQNEVIIYLLSKILEDATGTATTPADLITASACYKCIPQGMQLEVITYLLCSLNNAVA